MNLENTALILEGGGLRGVYTSGVLRFFMDEGIFFPYVIGVSMGACNAANYVSRQPERNKIVNTHFVNDAQYLSYFRLLTKGELFGMDFIFDTIPNSLVPFDYRTFMKNDVICVTTVVDCETGEALYFEKNEVGEDYFKVLRASTSLPFIAKPVHYKGRILMDGGLVDSVPIRKSIHDGNSKHVLVLTRPKGYRKKPAHFSWLAQLRYPKYQGLCAALANRPMVYNDTMDFVDELEEKGELFVIRPESDLNVGRAERNKDKLFVTYDKGFADASACHEALSTYLQDTTSRMQ